MTKKERRRIRILDILPAGVILLLVLVTFVLPHWIGRRFSSHPPGSGYKDKADIVGIENALEQYAFENNGQFPETLDVLTQPDENGFRFLDRDELPVDQWGRPYGYERPSHPGLRPRVFTLGSDGRVGGEGDARDLDGEMARRGGI